MIEYGTHSSTLAWRIPWMEEPGGLQPMGSHRVGHDGSDLAAAVAVQSQGVSRVGSVCWLGDKSLCQATLLVLQILIFSLCSLHLLPSLHVSVSNFPLFIKTQVLLD